MEEEIGTSRENEEEKEIVLATIYNEKTHKYLVVKGSDKALFTSILEKGETALECALKNAVKQAGTSDLELSHKTPYVCYHTEDDGKHYKAQVSGYCFKLTKDIDIDNEELEWVSENYNIKDELHNKIFSYI